MLIWRGWGIVILLIGMACVGLGQLLTDLLFGKGTYTDNAKVLNAIYLTLAAAIIWFVGRRLNNRDAYGKKTIFNAAHSFMFIRVEYWAFLFVVFAIASVVVTR